MSTPIAAGAAAMVRAATRRKGLEFCSRRFQFHRMM